jgi:hypothetical protein
MSNGFSFITLFLQSYGLVPPQIDPCDPKMVCGSSADQSCSAAVDNCVGKFDGVDKACDEKELCGKDADPKSANCTKAMDACMADLVSQPQHRGLVRSDVQEFWYLKQNTAILNETFSDRVSQKVNLIGSLIERIPKWLWFVFIFIVAPFVYLFAWIFCLILIRMLGDEAALFKLIMMLVFAIVAIVLYVLLIKLNVL